MKLKVSLKNTIQNAQKNKSEYHSIQIFTFMSQSLHPLIVNNINLSLTRHSPIL
jgi:hypothetical protein